MIPGCGVCAPSSASGRSTRVRTAPAEPWVPWQHSGANRGSWKAVGESKWAEGPRAVSQVPVSIPAPQALPPGQSSKADWGAWASAPLRPPDRGHRTRNLITGSVTGALGTMTRVAQF